MEDRAPPRAAQSSRSDADSPIPKRTGSWALQAAVSARRIGRIEQATKALARFHPVRRQRPGVLTPLGMSSGPPSPFGFSAWRMSMILAAGMALSAPRSSLSPLRRPPSRSAIGRPKDAAPKAMGQLVVQGRMSKPSAQKPQTRRARGSYARTQAPPLKPDTPMRGRTAAPGERL